MVVQTCGAVASSAARGQRFYVKVSVVGVDILTPCPDRQIGGLFSCDRTGVDSGVGGENSAHPFSGRRRWNRSRGVGAVLQEASNVLRTMETAFEHAGARESRRRQQGSADVTGAAELLPGSNARAALTCEDAGRWSSGNTSTERLQRNSTPAAVSCDVSDRVQASTRERASWRSGHIGVLSVVRICVRLETAYVRYADASRNSTTQPLCSSAQARKSAGRHGQRSLLMMTVSRTQMIFAPFRKNVGYFYDEVSILTR